MLSSWKNFWAIVISIIASFSIVWGCELIKTFSPPREKQNPEPALSKSARVRFYFSKAIREMAKGKPHLNMSQTLPIFTLNLPRFMPGRAIIISASRKQKKPLNWSRNGKSLINF